MQIKNIEKMGKENRSTVTEFILLGFSEYPHLKLFVSVTVFLIFLISVLGNFIFLLLVCAEPHLQKPMYFFLSSLSFLDICNSSVTLSTLLKNLLTGNMFISFSVCMAQFYFFISLTATEILLLAAMAYDRYIAICNPLHYVLIMNRRVCVILASSSWIIGFVETIPQAIMTSHISFCRSNEINHFFCETSAMMKLSCSDLLNLEILILIEVVFEVVIPFGLTLTSYCYIICSILKMYSAKGRHKAFSTCSFHLTIVILFYGSLIFMYMRPPSMYSPKYDKLFSLLYTALIPMLNPIIYSLRNKDVNKALTKLIGVNYGMHIT
uniref:Olfactory receptor n=1 Tax=Geotrypetes seraphini TaxID=260995 RepID=A0A6P8QC99_GEOSA|nr:olfactory receptor 1019-like [Geotrypetes seraphini]